MRHVSSVKQRNFRTVSVYVGSSDEPQDTYQVKIGSTFTYRVTAVLSSSGSGYRYLYLNGNTSSPVASSRNNNTLTTSYATLTVDDDTDLVFTASRTISSLTVTVSSATYSNEYTDADESLYPEDSAVETVTLGAGNWSHTFEVPVTQNVTVDGETYLYGYTYYAEEQDVPAGYTVSYIGNDGITGGKVYVINTAKTVHYRLPETGGGGRLVFYLTAVSMMSLSAAALFVRRKRLRGGGNTPRGES